MVEGGAQMPHPVCRTIVIVECVGCPVSAGPSPQNQATPMRAAIAEPNTWIPIRP